MFLVQLIIVLLSIAAVLSVFIVPILAGAWVLRPLDRAAKHFRRPTRFTILDFFGLVFLVQMPMAVIHGFVPRSETGLYWTFMVLGWLVSAAVWAAAVKTFSNAGIEGVWTRALLVFFVLPMAYFGTFSVVILGFAIYGAEASDWGRFGMLASAVGIVACVAASGIITRRIAPEQWRYNASEENPFAKGERKSPQLAPTYAQALDEMESQQQAEDRKVQHLFRDSNLD